MTINVPVRNGAIIHSLTQSIQHGLANVANVPGLVARVKDENMWREFQVKSTGEHVSYASFDGFVRAPIPRGCDTTPEIIESMGRLASSMTKPPEHRSLSVADHLRQAMQHLESARCITQDETVGEELRQIYERFAAVSKASI